MNIITYYYFFLGNSTPPDQDFRGKFPLPALDSALDTIFLNRGKTKKKKQQKSYCLNKLFCYYYQTFFFFCFYRRFYNEKRTGGRKDIFINGPRESRVPPMMLV